ncbi:MAG: DUF72 domain-containing protein [Leeuwenhoekiella sp.]|nr:DUF72 domain-containing protein [Leeuwenhoekiella sp.]
MQFGKVENPEHIDFTLPADHPDTEVLLKRKAVSKKALLSVGCAKWNKQDLKNFYPKGIRDELDYYSRQFNSIELNATFLRLFPKEQFEKWYAQVPADFRFFPKITRNISHLKRLVNVSELIPEYLEHTLLLKEKLGCIFLQMHNNFQPKNWDRVGQFIDSWPGEVPLAIEFRHTDWFSEPTVSKKLYRLLEENNISNILVDTAGRRDIMHMRLTTSEAFIRFVATNHPCDYYRLDAWIDRLEHWLKIGLYRINFFMTY